MSRRPSSVVLVVLVLLVAPPYANAQETARRSLDVAPFEQLCTLDELTHSYRCRAPLSEFPCDSLSKPPDTLAWLEPPLPIMSCRKRLSAADSSERGVYRIPDQMTGGIYEYQIEYIVWKDGRFELLRSEEEFRETFAPVQTVEEAFAFIVALNKGSLVFDPGPILALQGGTYRVPKPAIKATSGHPADEGFIINAYSDDGDCSEIIYKKTLLVKRKGEVSEQDSEVIWESDRKPRCVF